MSGYSYYGVPVEWETIIDKIPIYEIGRLDPIVFIDSPRTVRKEFYQCHYCGGKVKIDLTNCPNCGGERR